MFVRAGLVGIGAVLVHLTGFRPIAMSSTASSVWRDVFRSWPSTIPRRGVVLSTLNEPTPFKSFLTKDDVVLLERTNPDPMGTRFVMIAYDAIHAVKFTEPLKESAFTAAGFAGKLSQA
jgi:hypothetical protein